MPNCKGCGAEIKWIRSTSGKMIPVNPKKMTIVTNEGMTEFGYEAHFSTCPVADTFRNRDKKDNDK